MDPLDGLLRLASRDRLELGCDISPGGGRVAVYLDDKRLFDREVTGGEGGGERLLLPPLTPGQHALRLTVFRPRLTAVARLELLANGESAHHLILGGREAGPLSDLTLYLDVV